ncbi:ECF transporter S component, partial [Chloroflexota bacterium]
MQRKTVDPRILALTAVMTAVVFVLTSLVRVPTPARGYIHLGDSAIFFSAFAFGPLVGGISGGLGTALADISGGYPQWAVFSLLI